ncbi:MAG: alpha-1,6-mannanase, partial [Bacteroidaceae bacterium]|nr:alpha-1,6-mannanase [Bacteroidaceae bacterium]
MMRLALLTLILTFCAGNLPAQNVSTTQQDDWAAYDAFNKAYLDSTKYIYKDFTSRQSAVDRWNGAAAIWC